jgi:hypothetical protein
MNFIAILDPSTPTGFWSMHGQTEVLGDLYELCYQDMTNATWSWTKFWNFISCVDTSPSSIPDNIPSCMLGEDFSMLKECALSSRGRNLLIESINKTDSLGWKPRPGSPTVYVNGKCVAGGTVDHLCDQVEGDDLRKLICDSYSGEKPKGCQS